MKVVVQQTKPGPQLYWPSDLKPGTVYSWGGKVGSYLRVAGGSVALSGFYAFLAEDSHNHFDKRGGAYPTIPWVEVSTDTILTLHYEV